MPMPEPMSPCHLYFATDASTTADVLRDENADGASKSSVSNA
jgi:hypothetical protein